MNQYYEWKNKQWIIILDSKFTDCKQNVKVVDLCSKEHNHYYLTILKNNEVLDRHLHGFGFSSYYWKYKELI